MKLIKIHETSITVAVIEAIAVLDVGGIVAYPTETFYGLGVKFDIENSLKRLYGIKQRPKEKAMPLIIGDKGLLSLIVASVNDTAISLMERFWPGPLTILLPAKGGLSEYIVSEGRVGVRIPGESFALYLAKEAGFPITATSANISGMPPAENAETVLTYFGDKIDLIVDGGPTPGGFPSTIVDVIEEEIRILREGAIGKKLLKGLK